MTFRASMNFTTIVLGFIILVELTIVIIQIVALLECKQCLLFGKILEVKRIVEGGVTVWCLMVIANGLFTIFICIRILLKPTIFGKHSQSSSKPKLWILLFVTVSNIATGCLVKVGWQQFCSTFQVVRCHLMDTLKLIDWRTYTPKYSRCSNNYIYYNIFQIGLLCCSLSWIYLLLVYQRNRSLNNVVNIRKITVK